ncbi:M81 family metallopeptidase [Arenibacterium halophilum]|uniref:Microcystinase C n=1 Tax=Arenibacterium halophilum TaxID=2583821 RepID=A0ABY2X0Z9_9RHOB|nr:M81 family metallopeptidase [Arenibacterium halophilum]TMV08313.1 M81 family metallopeptidase [Arenibacterium halophilum]
MTKPRLFIGGIATETNTFSTVPTTLRDFEKGNLFYGDATRSEPQHFTAPLHLWRSQAERDGFDVVEGLLAAAQPGGTTLAAVWERLLSRLVQDVVQAGRLDVILLNLHGAMVADGEFDCEGALLAAIRDICPGAIIGCELDLHCHLTDRMMQNADLIVPYKEYPHTDIVARAEDLWRLALATHRQEINPTMAMADCHMVSTWHTTTPPLSDVIQDLHRMESDGTVLSASFCHGFDFGDTPDMGAKTLVITNDDPASAELAAQALAQRVWAIREATRITRLDQTEAVAQAMATQGGPVVIADTADNPGIGAGADSTYLLTALIDAQAKGAIVGLMYDPMACEICFDAGAGAGLTLRIGGKFWPRSGPPVDLDVRVMSLTPDHVQTAVSGQKMRCGNVAVVETTGGVRIALTDLRVQTFNPDAFTGLGLDLTTAPVIVVKSTQHFYAGFAQVASHIIYCETPTAIIYTGPDNPFRHRDGDYWPLVDVPSAWQGAEAQVS